MGSECGMYRGNIHIQGGTARVLATESTCARILTPST